MEKIVLLKRHADRDDRFISVVRRVFPECDVCMVDRERPERGGRFKRRFREIQGRLLRGDKEGRSI